MTEYCRWHSTRRHTHYPPAPAAVAAPPADAPHPHARWSRPPPVRIPLLPTLLPNYPPLMPPIYAPCSQLAPHPRPHLPRLLPPNCRPSPSLWPSLQVAAPLLGLRSHCHDSAYWPRAPLPWLLLPAPPLHAPLSYTPWASYRASACLLFVVLLSTVWLASGSCLDPAGVLCPTFSVPASMFYCLFATPHVLSPPPSDVSSRRCHFSINVILDAS